MELKEIIQKIKDKIESTKKVRTEWDGTKVKRNKTMSDHARRYRRQGMRQILEIFEQTTPCKPKRKSGITIMDVKEVDEKMIDKMLNKSIAQNEDSVSKTNNLHTKSTAQDTQQEISEESGYTSPSPPPTRQDEPVEGGCTGESPNPAETNGCGQEDFFTETHDEWYICGEHNNFIQGIYYCGKCTANQKEVKK